MDISWALIFYFACFLFLTSEGSSLSKRKQKRGVHWGYTPQNGPEKWGGICQTGTKQSPINIQLGSVIVKKFSPFFFGKDFTNKQKFMAKNNGHTIYAALENDTAQPYISGGGLGGKYIFEQLHFHWESEHELEGKRADLEMHMVHYNSKYKSFSEASTKPDGLAVFAVLFNESKQTDKIFENFFAYILDMSTVLPIHTPVEFPENALNDYEDALTTEFLDLFKLRDLLPKHVSRFFRYDGSLTTPGCGEVAQWTVFINRFPVSKQVLESFKTLRDHDNNLLSQNFRPPQKLNGRPVYIQILNYDENNNENLNNNGNVNLAQPFYLLCCLFVYMYNK